MLDACAAQITCPFPKRLDSSGSRLYLRQDSKLEIRNKQMCRNIKTLHNFKPPATEQEIRASAIQFVRKLSGFTKPSKANEAVFNQAVDEVTEAANKLIDSLITTAPPRDREVEAMKARARAAERFGASPN